MADGVDGAALQGIGQTLDFLFGSQFGTACQHLVAHTVAFGQQQHLFFAQKLRCNGIKFFKVMAFGNNDEERFVIQRLGYDARLLEWFGNDDCIDIATFERLGQDVGIVLFQHQRHFRRGFTQRGNELGQKVGGNGENQAEFERAFQFVLLFIGKVLDEFGFFQNPAGLGDNALARFGRDDVVAATVEQGYRQLFLQLFDGDGEGGLADKAASCGTSEVTFLCDGYDVTQFGQGHVLSLFLFRQGDVQLKNVQAVLFLLGDADVVQ